MIFILPLIYDSYWFLYSDGITIGSRENIGVERERETYGDKVIKALEALVSIETRCMFLQKQLIRHLMKW